MMDKLTSLLPRQKCTLYRLESGSRHSYTNEFFFAPPGLPNYGQIQTDFPYHPVSRYRLNCTKAEVLNEI